MNFNKKQFIVHYMVTGLLLAVLVFYSVKLHRYSYYSRQLITAIQSFSPDSTRKNTLQYFDSNFSKNIENQLAAVSASGFNWAGYFKKDSLAYPRNLLAYTFSGMGKFDLVLQDMDICRDTITCHLFIRDKMPFTITVIFVKKGDRYLVDNLDNIGALYNRLNCYQQYLSEKSKAALQ